MNNNVAIITGASRGIGATLATGLAAQGIAVIVNYAHGDADAHHIVDQIIAAGGQAMALQADLSQPESATRLFDAAEAAFGQANILINNAGIMELGLIKNTNDDCLEKHLAINLEAPFRLMREASSRLKNQGRIINFSSSMVGLNQPHYGIYAATKAAIESLTHILAKELGSQGITVNAVAPGPVATALFLKDKSPALIEGIKRSTPLGRLGEPQDIMQVVSFLVGEQSQWINGQVIRINGGIN